jgi:hypothetical protein
VLKAGCGGDRTEGENAKVSDVLGPITHWSEAGYRVVIMAENGWYGKQNTAAKPSRS